MGDRNSQQRENQIGYVVGGGLKEGLRVRLTVDPQSVQEGGFVVIDTGEWQFYGLITDIQLGATDPRFADEKVEDRLPPAISQLLHGQTLYANLEVLPALMLKSGRPEELPSEDASPIPVKTIPPHHAPVLLASAGNIAEIFGSPNEEGNFVIGKTREQGHPVCINLKKFVQRSSGIFGATGTGKSFLTRIILAGLIDYNKTSLLVFDMHNEYGFDDTASDTGKSVKGLRTLFPGKVRVVELGSRPSQPGRNPDFHLEIAEKDIQPEDIELLTRELNLKETTPTTLHALVTSFGIHAWYRHFKAMKPGTTIEGEDGKRVPAPDSVEAWANEAGVNIMAALALHDKMRKLFDKPYIVPQPAADSLGEIIRLLKQGMHVMLSFGSFDSDLDYLLVTNLITRRIRREWEEMTNQHRANKKTVPEPRPLTLVVEEAHKLLNREMASQTIFSTIAREMRKYFVTLLIVDQRPSQIYDEVMSQLGTRICGWLGDDSDIQAVLSGLAGRDALRGMLAHLQPTQEVLLLGWGISMPIPVRTLRYDEEFYRNIKGGSKFGDVDQINRELGFDL